MISQTVNGLERRLVFRPGYHKVSEDPKKDYGVHGMEIHFYLIGNKGAVHFIMGTSLMLKETYEWWNATDREMPGDVMRILNTGIDVGYHSPTQVYEGQEVRWPIKMNLKDGYDPDMWKKEPEKVLSMVSFDKIGDEPSICDIIGVPCFSDGSALASEKYYDIFLREGDEPIWKMLESDYQNLVDSQKSYEISKTSPKDESEVQDVHPASGGK